MTSRIKKKTYKQKARYIPLICSLQGGDDETAESGTEMVVRFGILGRRGMVAEMLAVVRITLFPLGTQGGVFQNGGGLFDSHAEGGTCRSLFR